MPDWLAAPNLAPAPLAIAVWAAASLGAFGVGWTLWRALGWSRTDEGPRFLAAGGLGFVLLAYCVLAAGLLGGLSRPVLIALPAAFLIVGARALPELFRAAVRLLRRALPALRRSPHGFLYALALLWLALTFLGVLGPSDARDWDGIGEHLAQAKSYLRAGRVEPLWFDHHSQFPATMVMLYSLGLALGGQGAAKLFHWGFAVLSLLAVWRLTRRHVAPEAGGPALWVLMTTPLFGWLATVGYVDLSSVFFSLLAADYVLAWRQTDARGDMARAGLMAGAGMAIKMQGLFTFGVLLLAAMVWAVRLRRGLRPLLVYAALAGALAAPWYIKSWVLTGNPVYPFAYGLFGGKQWSSAQARPYAYHHASFGYGKLPAEHEWHELSALQKRLSGPRSPLMMLIAPFTLTWMPEYYSPRQPRMTAIVMLSVGPMYLGLAPLLAVLRRRKPPAAGWLALIFAAFWLWWLQTTQLQRYLLPWLALTAPLAGLALAWLMRAERPVGAVFRTLAVVWSLMALVFLVWQVVPLAPVALGLADARAHLALNLDCYAPIAQVNRYTPPDALIGTYGEPRLFYLDRPYLWADPGHSLLIDYQAADTPEKLAGEYRRLGIDYLLINQQFFGPLGETKEKLHDLLIEGLAKGLLVPEPMPSRRFLLLRVSES